MAKKRSTTDQQVADLLRTAKDALNLSVAFLTRMDGTTQHLEVVESSVPFLFREGATQRQETSLCQVILDDKLPAVIPDVKAFPVAMALPAARLPRIRSYVSVPVTLSDGTLYGTFCAAGLTSDKQLTKRDKALMEVLASATSLIIEPGIREDAARRQIEDRLVPLIAAGGPVVVLQPIVELSTGDRVGAEALSRFPRAWDKAPDICFDEAHQVGLGDRLEVMALAGAAAHLEDIDGYVSMNVSPGTLLTQDCQELLRSLPLKRVLLELSEHDSIADYEGLLGALAPLRAAGMRLAIDDVGAGFSSLRHIVLTTPDVIKIDRSLVFGVEDDPVLRTLVRSLVDFAAGCGATVVAEGVETAAAAEVLLSLGVDYGQGWHHGRPCPAAELSPVPVREQVEPRAAMPPTAPTLRRAAAPAG